MCACKRCDAKYSSTWRKRGEIALHMRSKICVLLYVIVSTDRLYKFGPKGHFGEYSVESFEASQRWTSE